MLHQRSHEAFLPRPPPLLQDHVQVVQERVQRRVERQHEDGHAHVDLSRDGLTARGQQSQKANGEPAQEVGHGDGEEAASDVQILRLSGRVQRGHSVGADRPEDGGLSGSDQEKDEEVEDDDDPEGVMVTSEVVPGDRQRNADACLAVEAPVGQIGQERNSSNDDTSNPCRSAHHVSGASLEAQATERKPEG